MLRPSSSISRSLVRTLAIAAIGGFGSLLQATQTENLSFRVLPAPGQVTIDGSTKDWDLSGGIFICDNVEEQADRFGVWFHAMYDRENLYLLARFNDPTPLDNPNQIAGGSGFNGDSLQFRTLFDPGTGAERILHFTAWRDRDTNDVVTIESNKDLKGPRIADAKATSGAQQAFRMVPGCGYDQELALPWKLLSASGEPLKAGQSFTFTIEPNFTVNSRSRLSLKDLFKPGKVPNRVFTFMDSSCWGTASLSQKGGVVPQSVRLASGDEVPVHLVDGEPVAEWPPRAEAPAATGVADVPFEMPFDGFVSLQIVDTEGVVVNQLLNAAPTSKGHHAAPWDGLTSKSWTRPGEPVSAGEYHWRALAHRGIGVKLRGWADNAGSAPWDGASGRENWGGDHGTPSAVACDESSVFLGWSGAEAGKSLLCCDLEGNVRWAHNRGGLAGVKSVAASDGTVYVLGGRSGLPSKGGNLYRLEAKTGGYRLWPDSGKPDLAITNLWPADAPARPDRADAVTVENGQIVLTFLDAQTRMFLDPVDGKFLRVAPLAGPSEIAAERDGIRCVATGAPRFQILVSQASSKKAPAVLGLPGGRPPTGPWRADGFREIAALALDAHQHLWVAESGFYPKRISLWDPLTGKLLREFFGPSSYGALGGAINPTDANLMVGQGCEWRIDPATGRATCLGTITQDGMQNARFAVGSNGRTYLATTATWISGTSPFSIYERVGDGDYRLRTQLFLEDKSGNPTGKVTGGKKAAPTMTVVWADENGDGIQDPSELSKTPGVRTFSRWFMNFGPDLSLFSKDELFKVEGFTGAGAPKYDLSRPIKLPVPGFVSGDSRLVLKGGVNNVAYAEYACYDIASRRRLWSYPDNFTGVHGSHSAPPPAIGLMRGSYGPCGSATLPSPIGNLWAIPTNMGEWHHLTQDGFYLSRLFEPDISKVVWPAAAVPGADMSHAPPGAGGEDFGGSITLGQDGHLYVQAGKTAYWNLEVTGLDTVRQLAGGKVTLTAAAVSEASRLRESTLQSLVGKNRLGAVKMTPKFTGNLRRDFSGAKPVDFKKGPETAVRCAVAWDETDLHLAWQVTDASPWINGAEAADLLYVGGDTVDFQLATDPAANPKRTEAALGDLRISIGNLKGAPVAVLFRPKATGPNLSPKSYSSGVVTDYTVDDVRILSGAEIKVVRKKDAYTVEASIPWTALGGAPAAGRTLRGDLGVTYGDTAGKRTRLRNYWNNQHTGLVDDVVFELKLEPKNWGEITFEQ